MKPKRLAIITHEYYPVLCGGTIFIENLAKQFEALGYYDVEILTAGVGNDFPRIEQAGKFKIRRFWVGRKSIHDATMLEHLLFFSLGLPQMFLYMLRNRFDQLFPVFVIPSGLIGVCLSWIYGIPSIVFVDAADTPGVSGALTNVVKHLRAVFSFVTKRSQGVVICEGLEDIALPMISNPQTTAIANGTVIPKEQAKPGTNGDVLQILSVGRLVFRKGFAEIIEALSIVKQQRSDFLLTIVGYGTGEAEIKEAITRYKMEANVRLAGRVEYQDLKAYYLRSDAYIFYGGREGSSLAMVEAVAYGLPVIASDHPGNRAYIKENESGFLADHDDPSDLARIILHILENKSKLAQWGQTAREMGQTFSWDKVATRYYEFFEKSIEESKKNAEASAISLT